MDSTICTAMNFFVPASLLPVASLLIPLYLSLMGQKNVPHLSPTVRQEYDYVIVGAGSAGSALAARLSELESASVLLLEAGGTPNQLNDIPQMGRDFWGSPIDWDYRTEPQSHTGRVLENQQVVWPSGKGVGGSSILNAMLYIRGSKGNFDEWAEMGNTDWSYEKVLPYFKKMEDNQNPDYLANGYHSTGGPITVEKPQYHSLMTDLIYETVTEMGYTIGDPNGPRMTGFSDFQTTTRNGERCSTAKGYLVPVENRTNLHIIANARATKILIEDGEAQGVEFDWEGSRRSVKARREVIMSAGTTNTAQLLMLSGIGPKEELDKLQIPIIVDLPVGKRMQDHFSVPLFYELDYNTGSEAELVDQYICNRTGLLVSGEGVDVMAFINTRNDSLEVDKPNIELYFGLHSAYFINRTLGLTAEVFSQVFEPYDRSTLYDCYCSLVQPRSEGWVRLKSADPYDPPLIDPNYLEHPDDMVDLIEGMRLCDAVALGPAMSQGVGSRRLNVSYPGCEGLDLDSDAYYACVARSVVVTMSHQVGTARMGPPGHQDTVVDQRLRVQGVPRLRVVDASVMPVVTSGNTNAPSIMIGEKAADLIKEDFMADQRN